MEGVYVWYNCTPQIISLANDEVAYVKMIFPTLRIAYPNKCNDIQICGC